MRRISKRVFTPLFGQRFFSQIVCSAAGGMMGSVMENTNRVELLAPAGSPEGFYGAVHAGANAVYLGGSRFGARAYAENFTEDELVECIRYSRLFGVKVYLTVNTLLKEQELKELPGYLEPFYLAGLEGVIVQDLGVLRLIREQFPGLKLHASTQMTICSGYGARLLKELGVCRVVPARELSLKELSAMKKEADIEIETFIHGAMCYCYSGQCLFSSILGGRSGNRGRCAQPCRLPYTVVRNGGKPMADLEQTYPLSLKDMCTIEHLPTLIESGIDSFKIEGRMKKPEYAAGVTAVYRKYIDLYYELRDKLGPKEAAEAYAVEEKDRNDLASLYIRSGIQEGYYFQKNGPQMVTLDNPAYNAADEELLAGIRDAHLKERSKLSIRVDAVFFTGKPASVILHRGNISVRVQGEIVQRAQNRPITEDNIQKQLGKLGDSPFQAEMIEVQVDEDAFYPLKQINELRRLAVGRLEQKLLEVSELYKRCRPVWSMDGDKKRPIESMNDVKPVYSVGGKDSLERNDDWVVSVRTREQLVSLYDVWQKKSEDRLHVWQEQPENQKSQKSVKNNKNIGKLCRIYLDGDMFMEEIDDILVLCRQFLSNEECPALYLALPYVLRKEDGPYLERLWNLANEGPFEGFLVRSLDGIGFLKERLGQELGEIPAKVFHLRTDAGLYVWNSLAAEELSSFADGFCLPYELNGSEQRELLRGVVYRGLVIDHEKIVYGRIPMMVTANCVVKTMEGCRKGRWESKVNGDSKVQGDSGVTVWLRDRYRKEFPVLTNCFHCTNLIYNSLPLALFGEGKKHRGMGALRLDFTLESGDEVLQILGTFMGGEKLKENSYTTGHEKRGVE